MDKDKETLQRALASAGFESLLDDPCALLKTP